VVLSFGIAIIIAERSADHLVWGFVCCAALAGIYVAVAVRWSIVRSALCSAAGILLLGYVYTLWSAVYLPADHVSRYLAPTPVTLEGQVLRLVKADPSRTTLDLAAQTLSDDAAVRSVSGRVRVTAYDFAPAVEEGDLIRVHRIRLRRPSGFRNPGSFDFGRYLALQGLYATGSVSKVEQVEAVRRSPGGFLTQLSRFKTALARQTKAAMGEDEAGITNEMVLGIRGTLRPEVREAFNASGTAHLLSVSGLHVAAIYGATFFVLKFLFIAVRFRLLGRFSGGPRPSKAAAVCALVAVIGYASLVTLGGLVDLLDPNFPAIRSTLMIASYVLAYLIDRDGDPFQTTALAALLILALHPFALFDIGFQLSFAGILAIFYAHRLLHPPGAANAKDAGALNLSARLRGKLRDAVLISVFASLGTAPLALYYFQRVPLIAPLANVIVIPLGSLAVPLGLLAAFAAQVAQPLGDVLLHLTGISVTLLYALVRFFASLPYAAPRIGLVSLSSIALAYGTLLLIPHLRSSRLARWSAVGGVVLVGLFLTWSWVLPEGRGHLQVTFLDVGQGEASFLRFPNGTTMLIDGGGSMRDDFDIGERVVAPFLWAERIRHVDYVVATHPHPDHAKGLLFILKNFPIQQFWDNGAPLASSWYSALREEAIRRGVYRDVVAEGFTAVTIDGVRLELLHPTVTFQPQVTRHSRTQEDHSENNRSLVLKLTAGSFGFLFPGDIEQEAETFLLQTGRDVKATVLKAPHHGSLTSSGDAFLRAVSPSAVVFSVGRDNRFHHPAAAILERYEAMGIRIFRTDLDGAITFQTDGGSLWVDTLTGRRAAVAVRPEQPLPEALIRGPGVGPWRQTFPSPAASPQTTDWGNRPESPAPPPLDSGECSPGFGRECR
jgi:competence protein ComEC